MSEVKALFTLAACNHRFGRDLFECQQCLLFHDCEEDELAEDGD